MTGRVLAVLVLLLSLAAAAPAQTCAWGSFDASRIHKPAGFRLDNGVYWGKLRNEIANAGGTVLAGTPTLTAGYLAQCDVFFTSILDDAAPALSNTEQGALSTWLSGGGTLIVSGLQIALPFYDSFTAPFGVTGYVGQTGLATGTTTGGSHPLIAGVTTFQLNGHCTFSLGSQASLLGQDGAGAAVMAVLEPATGFTSGGRIFVFGEAEMLDDLELGNADHAVLLGNMVLWACAGGCPGFFAPYGVDCPGTGGVAPTLAGAGCPSPGETIQVSLSGAAPNRTSFTLIGLGQGVLPVTPGCSLQNAPVLPQVVTLPTGASGGWTLPANLPPTLTTPADVYLQTLIDDPLAPFGAAATRPVQLHLE